jgi:hypothetical protein
MPLELRNRGISFRYNDITNVWNSSKYKREKFWNENWNLSRNLQIHHLTQFVIT